jgi:hypothetical protein
VARTPTQDQFLDYVNDLHSRNTELQDLVDKLECRMRHDRHEMRELIRHADFPVDYGARGDQDVG